MSSTATATVDNGVVVVHASPDKQQQQQPPSKAVVPAPARPAFLEFLSSLHSVWSAPRVTIAYQDLSVLFPAPLRAKSTRDPKTGEVTVAVPNILSTLGHWSMAPIHTAGRKLGIASAPPLYSLEKVSGVIHPGTMTLLLAPPGHGKSTLLKALSGRAPYQEGQLRFNGQTPAELAQAGIQLERLAAYVGQLDAHFPTLTVRETLGFAADSSVPDAGLLGTDGRDVSHLVEAESRRGDMLLDMLGLSESADVIIGSEAVRGISGGQKKRVTLGEMIVSNARLFALDEVSTGLDAAVTTNIFGSMREMCRITGSSVMAALLQPTPETYELFDEILLLHEGRVMYHGPRVDIKRWLWNVCGLDVPVGVDEASFLVDFLVNPTMAYESAKVLAQTHSFMENTRTRRQADEMARELQAQVAQGAASRPTIVGDAGEHVAEFAELHHQQSTASFRLPLATAPAASGPEAAPDLYSFTTFSQTAEAQQAMPEQVQRMVEAAVDDEPSAVRFHLQEDQDEGAIGVEPTAAPGEDASDVKPKAQQAAEKVRRLGARGPLHSTIGVPPVNSMTELADRYAASLWYSKTLSALSASTSKEAAESARDAMVPSAWSEYTRACYARSNPHPYARHLTLCFARQYKLFRRNLTVLVPRMCKALSIGLFYGLLFFQLGLGDFTEKMAICMYASIYAAMTNLSELPVASEARNVISKQIRAGFFPASPYYLSVLTMHVPLTIVESFCYSLLIYFISDMAVDAGRYFFYLLVCFLCSNAMATFYRFVSYITPNPDVAKQLDLPFVVLFIILNAFIIVYSKIPAWLRYWAFWVAPLQWGTKALTLNEFNDAKYDGPAPNRPDQRIGDYYLETFDLPTDFVWKWMGPVYFVGWFLLWSGICMVALSRLPVIAPIGSERETYEKKQVATAPKEKNPTTLQQIEMAAQSTAMVAAASVAPAEVVVDVVPKRNAAFQLSALPFTPVTLSWSNLEYSVTLPTGQERVLLHDVNGYGAPGHMTALMGASGAGKTTLMDCIAGRKTTGHFSADVRVNGQTVDIHSAFFQQLCGYVEQTDLHIGTATVQEALRFSAQLRLPTTVDQPKQHQFVDEVMQLLGLTPFRHSLIGDAAIPGLAPAQLKLVTIGVELVANPAILFLDEPTSGLDAPAAWRVMTAIKRISLTGRTVLCTIHQPAARLFYLFDHLLLLRPGGKTIYCAEVGACGETLVAYFEAASGFTEKLPAGANPANWMLDITTSSSLRDWSAVWTNSHLNQSTVVPAIARACDPKSYSAAETALVVNAHSSSPSAGQAADPHPSWWTRYWAVQERLFVSYWRNGPMNLTRAGIVIIISLLLGLIYYRIRPTDYAGVNSILAGLFMTLGFGPSLPASAALPTFFRQRAVYYRESTVRMYGYGAYALSLTISEVVAMAILMFLYVVPLYFLMSLADSGHQFWKMYLVLFLLSQVFTAISQFYLAYLPNQIAASVVHSIVFSFLFVFGGLLVTAKAMPIGWKWFYAMITTPKAYVAVALSQLSCSDALSLKGGFGCGYITTPDSTTPVQVYEYVSGLLQNSQESYGNQIGWLFLQIVVIKVVTLVGFRFISHLKR